MFIAILSSLNMPFSGEYSFNSQKLKKQSPEVIFQKDLMVGLWQNNNLRLDYVHLAWWRYSFYIKDEASSQYSYEIVINSVILILFSPPRKTIQEDFWHDMMPVDKTASIQSLSICWWRFVALCGPLKRIIPAGCNICSPFWCPYIIIKSPFYVYTVCGSKQALPFVHLRKPQCCICS